MKKVAGILILSAVVFNANAQRAYIQGGANFANITETNSGSTNDNNILTSFNVGLMGTLGLSETVDIESGLLLTGKGSKAETNFSNGDYVRAKFNPLYVELPVNLLVNFPINKDNKIFVSGGPYVAVGVAGKSKTDTKFGPLVSSGENDIQFSNDNPTTSQQEGAGYNRLKRFDYGVNFGGGFALKNIIIKANYGLGLVKINSTESNNSANDKNKFRTASVSIGIPL